MKPFQVIAVIAVIALLTGLIIPFEKLMHGTEPVPVLGKVQHFKLMDEHKGDFESASLDGKVWLANFFFTSCGGICPMITSELKKIDQQFADAKNLHIVSITVDPMRDSPTALREYRAKHEIMNQRWHFLTGQIEDIEKISMEGFKLGNADNPAFHSDRIVLIDRQSRIRGYYSGTDQEALQRLFHDLETVLNE